MNIEQKANYFLNRYPKIKKVTKRIYQLGMYAISPKIKSEGDIVRISPNDKNHEYFFGYYDKSPWDITDRYVLCLRAKDTWSDVSPKEKADIIIIDTKKKCNERDRIRKIAETRAWNVQQACMLQWLGSDCQSRIIYNDYRNGKLVAVILDIKSGKEKIIDMPVYTVSADGKTALTLDFSRLYNLRPGYGYYNVEEKTKGIGLPDSTAIWRIDLESGVITPLLSYRDFYEFQPRSEMTDANTVHKVNHLMLSPDGKRFMVLYRWFNGQRKYTRLITCDVDGNNMYLLSDDDMVSHCYWKNNKAILAFENKKGSGTGYYLMLDKTQKYIHCWPQLSGDGHPSYSPDGSRIVTDSYPDRARVQYLRIMDGKNERNNDVRVVAKVFSPFKYDNDTRCDLHPRWNRAGDKICFDSVFEGHRGLYSVKVRDNNSTDEKIKVLFLLPSCKKMGPTQQMLNIITNIDKTRFEPILMTIYPEVTDGTSQLSKFTDIVPHIYAPTSKTDVMLGRFNKLEKALERVNPDVIHSLGVFPDYAISRIKKYPQILTLRNYVWEDYPAKFGKIQGTILAKLHLYAMQHTAITVACSESLSNMYRKKLNLHYDFIRNGVDIEQYTKPSDEEKIALRSQLNLPKDAVIFVYSGQVIERKNQRFLLKVFADTFKDSSVYLLLLGDGAEYEELKTAYGNVSNIDFRGNVTNVNEYLKACDVYVSTSKSEGMPNGVLEAMATGLPVVLSDIEQHKEVFEADDRIGFLYEQDSTSDLSNKMTMIIGQNYLEMGAYSYSLAHNKFDARTNCEQYERIYSNISQKKYAYI